MLHALRLHAWTPRNRRATYRQARSRSPIDCRHVRRSSMECSCRLPLVAVPRVDLGQLGVTTLPSNLAIQRVLVVAEPQLGLGAFQPHSIRLNAVATHLHFALGLLSRCTFGDKSSLDADRSAGLVLVAALNEVSSLGCLFGTSLPLVDPLAFGVTVTTEGLVVPGHLVRGYVIGSPQCSQ